MKRTRMQTAIIVAIAVGGFATAGPAAAESAQEKPNFGSHVSHCAHVMGGFSSDHNPSMMKPMPGTEHCQMPG